MKLLYVMNVEWNWIKQRPHFLAECLSGADGLSVEVLYPKRFSRRGLQSRDSGGLDLMPIPMIPRISAYENLRFINDRRIGKWIRKEIRRTSPDAVYLTYPTQIPGIPSDYKGKVLYDCMDNHPAFFQNRRIGRKIGKMEALLCHRADRIYVSSASLSEILKTRCEADPERIRLLRNAFDGRVLPAERVRHSSRRSFTADDPMRIVYFGTISSWFDFDMLLKSLRDFPNIEYRLYGPVEVDIPRDRRIRIMGTIEHDRLFKVAQEADCFIMPFVLNDIIRAVDPVKLYEYINFGRNTIAVRYDEIERFAPFVRFYSGYDGFRAALQAELSDPSPVFSDEERVGFLQRNTWNARSRVILQDLGIC